MLISLSVDYLAADVATRERFHVPPAHLRRIYEDLGPDGVAEVALLTTCNRTELFAWCPTATPDTLPEWHSRLAARWIPGANEARDLLDIARPRAGLDVARHAVRIAVGLESQILGDGQILGQVRTAYAEASRAGATGTVLHRLFEITLRAAKRVQTSTLLGSGRNSVGAQAAALAARRFGELSHARAVVVGCGKTGERIARQLAKFGARDLVFLNRSPERADALARDLAGRSAPMETLYAEVAMADMAFLATSAHEPLLTPAPLAQARTNCATASYPLLLVDLSMPRNIDPAVTSVPGVTLVDLDALRPELTATEQSRRSAIPAAEAIVETELREFRDWLAASGAREAIRPMRDALAAVCYREVAFAAGEEMAERIVERIVAKMMARPMTAVRSALSRGEPVADIARTMGTLFSAPVRPLHARPAALAPQVTPLVAGALERQPIAPG